MNLEREAILGKFHIKICNNQHQGAWPRTRQKNKELSQIEVEYATPRILFTIEVESMVIQQFTVPRYPPPLQMVGLVVCMHFMFFGYDWESDNLVG